MKHIVMYLTVTTGRQEECLAWAGLMHMALDTLSHVMEQGSKRPSHGADVVK